MMITMTNHKMSVMSCFKAAMFTRVQGYLKFDKADPLGRECPSRHSLQEPPHEDDIW